MLVVSRERFLPTTINTLVLSKDDYYFYVHRDVYDQAVVLSDRFPSPEPLLGDLGVVPNEGNDLIIDWAWSNLPKPINILAPFLHLVDGPISEDIEEICGVLHAITAVINVRSFIKQPKELRKSVTFSLSVKEEYEMPWERFFMSAIPYDQRNSLSQSYTKQESNYPSSVSDPSMNVYSDDQGNIVFEESEEESLEDMLAEMGIGPSSSTEVEEVLEEVKTSSDEKSETRKLLKL